MSFAISDDHLPAILTVGPMSDEAFSELCAEHPDMMFEMTAEGELIIIAPTHSYTGSSGLEISRQLGNWAIQDGRGKAGDSSTGYVLPNGARRSPDAAWTLRSRIKQLDPKSRKGFWHLCPDFVIELRSDSDRISACRKKMREYIANGAQLGWLIDPVERAVTIYRPDREPEQRTGINSIAGEGLLASFTMDLTLIWDPEL